MKIENVAIGRVASVAEAKKIIRLADVGELEVDLKKDLAEEEAKGKAADVLYCESISVLEDPARASELMQAHFEERRRGHA